MQACMLSEKASPMPVRKFSNIFYFGKTREVATYKHTVDHPPPPTARFDIWVFKRNEPTLSGVATVVNRCAVLYKYLTQCNQNMCGGTVEQLWVRFLFPAERSTWL